MTSHSPGQNFCILPAVGFAADAFRRSTYEYQRFEDLSRRPFFALTDPFSKAAAVSD